MPPTAQTSLVIRLLPLLGMRRIVSINSTKLAHLVFLILCVLVVADFSGCYRNANARKQQYFASGKQYFEAGKYPEATIQFENAIQIDKTFAPAHYQLAQCYLQQGVWGSAYRELTITTELDPNNWQAQLDLANLYFGARQFRQAKARAQSILKGDATQVSAQLLLANSDAGLGNLADALAEAQKAVQMAPDKPVPYVSWALLQEQNHQLRAAEDSFQKAISLDQEFLPSWLALGNFYQRHGRWPEAESEFRTAMQVAPDNSVPRSSLAALYLVQGKKQEAEQILLEAKNTKPNDPVWYRMLGDFYVVNHELDKAIAEFLELHKRHPDDVRVTKTYVKLLADNKQFDQAMQLVEEILAHRSTDADALVLKGQILGLQHRTAEAIPVLELAVRDDPESSGAHFQLGRAYAQAGNLDAAEHEWRACVGLHPSMLEAQQELATSALRKNDMDLLDEAASAWLSYAPSAPQGYLMRGTVRIKRGDYPGAEADLHKTIDLDPNSAVAFSRLGDLRAYQKRFSEAQNFYEQALQLDPRSTEALQELANLLMALKQGPRALQRVQLQVAKAPDVAGFHLLLGQLLLANKNASAAQAEFAKSLALDNSRSAALLLEAKAQEESGSLDQAASTYDRLLQAEPKNPEPCVDYALLEERRGNWQHAEKLYGRALDLQADQPTAANNLSYLILEHGGDMNYAFSLAQIARRGMPDSPSAADTLAWAYYKKGIYGSAIDLLRDATRSSPQNATFYYHLALVYEKSNQPVLAKSNFQHALDLNPNSPLAGEIRQAMNELRNN